MTSSSRQEVINGFNTFYPHQLKLNTQKPNVVLTSLEIFNQKIDTQKDGTLPEAIDHLKEIHLSYKDNVITLNYAALSYCTPQKNQYAYMLEGFDKGWNYVGSQHSTTYTNLPAGTYTFRVKASNNYNYVCFHPMLHLYGKVVYHLIQYLLFP